jgi:hypothetical protein
MDLNALIFELKEGESLFIKDLFEELVVKITNNNGTLVSIAKRKGSLPYSIDFKSEIIYEARLGGELISKNEFLEY